VKKPLLLLLGVVLLTALPFVHRAYFVDDHYFVTIARGILEHPLRPYDFRSDDAGLNVSGWERGEKPRMVNPLLFHYYLAGVIWVWGDQSWKLRTSSLVFSVLAVWAMFFLGKRFVRDPLYPALLMAVTPAYWLTSYSLLIDTALLAFLLMSLLAFVKGLEQRSMAWILLAGLLMGCTMLTKYFGAIVFPLAALWQLIHPDYRRWKPGYAAFIIAGVVLVLWSVWNIWGYGQAHLLASFARGVKIDEAGIFYLYKVLSVGSFLAGGTVFMIAGFPLLWRRSRLISVAVCLAMSVLAVLFASRAGGFTVNQSLQFVFWLGASGSFLIWLFLQQGSEHQRSSFYLLFWVGIALAELIVVMPWTAGRYLLCLLPALCWLFDRALEQERLGRWKKYLLGMTAVVALCVAHGDYVQANAIESLARRLQVERPHLERLAPPPARWFYLADSFDGSESYLASLGWQNVFPSQTFTKGDLFLRAHYRKSSWWRMERMDRFQRVSSWEYQSWNPLRVMDVPGSAGWYASCWGALPFTVRLRPLERFELYQVVSE